MGTPGSGLFGTSAPQKPHLVTGPGGLSAEVADLRKDLAVSLGPLLAVTVEEFDLPLPATTNAFMTAIATVAAAKTYLPQVDFTGTTSPKGIYPARNFTVTTAGATATHAPTQVTVNGLDAQGLPLSEVITGVNGGAATYSGVKCFSQILSVVAPAAGGVDATMAFGFGSVMGLSYQPQNRTASPWVVPTIDKELYDGAVVTNGLLTLPATNPPYGAYTPNTGPAAVTASVVTGTVDITAGALYGGGGSLDGLVLTMSVNGHATTLTLDVTTNALNEAALLAAILAKWPELASAVQGGGGGNKLVLTAKGLGVTGSVIIVTAGGGSGAAALGLAGATTTGTGHRYAIKYEIVPPAIPAQK